MSHRTRTWARLDIAEKGLFRCALWLVKARGRITNMRFMAQIVQVALKLLNTVQSRIVKAGKTKAMMMLRAYSEPSGVFTWAPQLREWLHDPGYIWYLGVIVGNA
jgi:hypothetical protein